MVLVRAPMARPAFVFLQARIEGHRASSPLLLLLLRLLLLLLLTRLQQ